MPPLRPSEWLSLKLVEKDLKDEDNYLNIKTGKMNYNNYKTSKRWGNVHIECNDELLKAINMCYDFLGSVDGYKYLFTDNKEQPEIIQNSNFTKFFKSIVGFKEMSPNDIRNLYCSTIPFDTSLEERAKIATIMKHSIQSQMLIYSKYNKNSYPDEDLGVSE